MMDEYSVENESIQRRRQLAQALLQQSQQQLPNGQMVGRVFVGTNPLQHLAQGLRGFNAKHELGQADQQQRELVGKQQARNQQDMSGFIQALRGQGQQVQPLTPGDDEGNANPVAQSADFMPPDRNKALALALNSQNPMLQQAGGSLLKDELTPQKPMVVGRSLIDPKTGQVVGTDSTWQAEQQAAREAREEQAREAREAKAEEIRMRLEDAQLGREERAALQRELAQMRTDSQREMRMLAGSLRPQQAPVAVMGDDGKPVYVAPGQAIGKRPASKTGENKLPTSALKMQQEELDAIGTASTIGADLDALIKQVDTGALKVGPVQNLVSKGRNFAGISDENSRNFQGLNATLEKLRNDSLKLNKGVQTEGDAVRAWNEVLTNLNDPKVMKQRLGEVKKINERAAAIRKMNVDQIRSNFSVEPLDATPYQNQPAAIGGGGGGFKIIGVK